MSKLPDSFYQPSPHPKGLKHLKAININKIIICQPIYIVGPCAAESREQVLETARELAAISCQPSEVSSQHSVPFIFRAGAWKPRTSPRTFQGIGEEALTWLAEAKMLFGMDVATEVATPEHVRKAIAAGMDYLWIGARTSANPMAVENLTPALSSREGGKIKGILIKNPVNEDAKLWIGNIERLEKTGIPVMAVHRGCGHQPCWRMAHQVRLARPDIPMLLDPSHMSGDAAKVPELMQMIPQLGLDGAMVEVHCHPAEALSDAKQQITPEELADRLRLTEHRPAPPDRVQTDLPNRENTELNWLRAEIDELDDKLWDTIAARMDVSRRIGEWKKANGVAPLQPGRYEEIVERLKAPQPPEGGGLRTEFKLALWELIHEESLRQQE